MVDTILNGSEYTSCQKTSLTISFFYPRCTSGFFVSSNRLNVGNENIEKNVWLHHFCLKKWALDRWCVTKVAHCIILIQSNKCGVLFCQPLFCLYFCPENVFSLLHMLHM